MFGAKKQPPIRSLIGEGTLIQGTVQFQGGLRIDGEVEGDIIAAGESRSVLVISEKARVTGTVKAGHVIINGTVMGPVESDQLLELQPKAHIEGDVRYAALEMHQGAVIEGAMQRLGNAPASERVLKLAMNKE